MVTRHALWLRGGDKFIAVILCKFFTVALLVIKAAAIILLVFGTYTSPYKTIFNHNYNRLFLYYYGIQCR